MKHSPVLPRNRLTAFGADSGASSRRLHPRNNLRCPVTISIVGGTERSGTTLDLGRDGLSLSTNRPIPPGSRCTLCLLLPEAGHERALQLDVKSVYSSYSAPGDFRIGMVFVGLDPQVEDTLRALSGAT